jgi:hypothetical protein
VHLGDICVPEQARVVYRYLRVQCENRSVLGRDERVDLHEARVRLRKGFVQIVQDLAHALGDLAFEAGVEDQLPNLVGEQAEQRIYVDPHDSFGFSLGDFFDIYAALSGE